MTKLRILTTIIYSMVLLFTIINLVGTNIVATKGDQLESVVLKKMELTKENNQIQVEIGQYTNLARIESEAERLGYRSMLNKQVIFHNPSSVALISK